MAANDMSKFDIKPLEGITTCCICTEVCMDPIVLPCSHAFCMKCFQESEIKSNKGQGDEMPCPICRQMFKIPPEGLHELSQNLFTEKLIQVTHLPDQSPSSAPILCDACAEVNEDADMKIPAADTYCVDCHQNFCPECSRQHWKFKSTRNHCLLPLNDHEGAQNLVIDQAPGICELHKLHILNIYCTDCKTVVCAMCFIDNHGNHTGCHVDKVVTGFRRQIESNVEAINYCRSKAETKKAQFVKMKDDLRQRVKNFECEVDARKDELKQLIDEHANSLLQSLYSIMQSKLQEIQMTTDDIDTYLSSLETYDAYYEKIMNKGSANDICCAFSDLSVRAVELQQQYQQRIGKEIHLHTLNFCFQKSGLEEFLEERCDNLIGGIAEEGDPKARKGINQSRLSQQGNEIERLRKEIRCEIENRESLRLLIVQLRIKMNKEVQASHRAFTEELSMEKANNDEHIKKLRETLDINKAENNQLKQKLNATIATNKSLQDQNDKLKQELEKGNDTNNFVQANGNGFVQEVIDACKPTIRQLEDDVKILKQEPKTTKIVELSYKSDPVLKRAITTKTTNARQQAINGLTILNEELFVVSKRNSEVEVYDLMSLTLKRRWHLKELVHPMDIGSCNRNKCVYIHNDNGIGMSKQLLRVDGTGNLIKNWSTGNDWGWSLSVTYESNIILCLHNKACLNEYSPNGKLIRQIRLSVDLGLRLPWHAIKLSNGHFVVSLGLSGDDLHSVCVVNEDGKPLKSVGAGWRIKRPVYLSVDDNGNIMVTDQLSCRVLLFDSDLQFMREIISKAKHKLQDPWRILLDESNGRLFVSDSKTDGRFLIFDLK